MNIARILKFLHPTAKSFIDYTVSDDSTGGGQYISMWNESTLGVKPSLADLAAIESSPGYLAFSPENVEFNKSVDEAKIDLSQDSKDSEILALQAQVKVLTNQVKSLSDKAALIFDPDLTAEATVILEGKKK